MQFHQPPRRQQGENILPMINVVFLLLIFFLISARIAPPEPFPVEPPESGADTPAEAAFILYLDDTGQPGYRDVTGRDATLAALKADLAEICATPCPPADAPPLLLRADGAVAASNLAALMPDLGHLGFARVDLATVLP